MVMIRAIIRPDKTDAVMARLMAEGFPSVTRMNVSGRGKQRGIKIGNVTYDEVQKELLMMVVKDTEKDFVIKTVIEEARTGSQGRVRRRKDIRVAGRRDVHRQLRSERDRRGGKINEGSNGDRPDE